MKITVTNKAEEKSQKEKKSFGQVFSSSPIINQTNCSEKILNGQFTQTDDQSSSSSDTGLITIFHGE